MLTCMRTSVDIPDPLLRRAKKLARERGTTLRALVLDGLARVLAGGAAPAKRYRVKDCSFKGDGLVEGLQWGDWDEIRERIYEGHGG